MRYARRFRHGPPSAPCHSGELSRLVPRRQRSPLMLTSPLRPGLRRLAFPPPPCKQPPAFAPGRLPSGSIPVALRSTCPSSSVFSRRSASSATGFRRSFQGRLISALFPISHTHRKDQYRSVAQPASCSGHPRNPVPLRIAPLHRIALPASASGGLFSFALSGTVRSVRLALHSLREPVPVPHSLLGNRFPAFASPRRTPLKLQSLPSAEPACVSLRQIPLRCAPTRVTSYFIAPAFAAVRHMLRFAFANPSQAQDSHARFSAAVAPGSGLRFVGRSPGQAGSPSPCAAGVSDSFLVSACAAPVFRLAKPVPTTAPWYARVARMVPPMR